MQCSISINFAHCCIVLHKSKSKEKGREVEAVTNITIR